MNTHIGTSIGVETEIPVVGARKTLVSLFSGGGGLDLGLEAAGFETVFATDIDPHSCTTLEMGKQYAIKHNLPFLRAAKIIQADVAQLSSNEILTAIGLNTERSICWPGDLHAKRSAFLVSASGLPDLLYQFDC